MIFSCISFKLRQERRKDTILIAFVPAVSSGTPSRPECRPCGSSSRQGWRIDYRRQRRPWSGINSVIPEPESVEPSSLPLPYSIWIWPFMEYEPIQYSTVIYRTSSIVTHPWPASSTTFKRTKRAQQWAFKGNYQYFDCYEAASSRNYCFSWQADRETRKKSFWSGNAPVPTSPWPHHKTPGHSVPWASSWASWRGWFSKRARPRSRRFWIIFLYGDSMSNSL